MLFFGRHFMLMVGVLCSWFVFYARGRCIMLAVGWFNLCECITIFLGRATTVRSLGDWYMLSLYVSYM